jgi:hypothetical protein
MFGISIRQIFLLLAFVSFVLGFLNVPKYNWMCGGFACLTLALWA